MSSDKLVFCSKCCMDGSAKEIVLDKDGVCNFCHIAQKELKMAEEEKPNLRKRIKKIINCNCSPYLDPFGGETHDNCRWSKQKYDCLIGLSGGVDSSTVLHYAIEEGLKVLCFTMDNGYNDPKADENVLKLVETLKVPFIRYPLDLDKFKRVQASYLKAGVINVEAVYDHLLMAATFEMAAKYGIKWIISGGNVASESIMPASWSYSARDLVNMKSIYKWATGSKLKASKDFPLCSLLKWNWYRWINGIKVFYLLDYLDYNRKESEQMLIEKYGFQSTGEKHEENIFTKWFQSFYLFEKFGIDKRKAHYASLINAG